MKKRSLMHFSENFTRFLFGTSVSVSGHYSPGTICLCDKCHVKRSRFTLLYLKKNFISMRIGKDEITIRLKNAGANNGVADVVKNEA